MAKIRAAIDGDAPTALFFKAPTISGLAREIEVLSAAAAQAKPIPAAPYTAEQLSKGVPCWPLQEHLLSQVWRLTVWRQRLAHTTCIKTHFNSGVKFCLVPRYRRTVHLWRRSHLLFWAISNAHWM